MHESTNELTPGVEIKNLACSEQVFHFSVVYKSARAKRCASCLAEENVKWNDFLLTKDISVGFHGIEKIVTYWLI